MPRALLLFIVVLLAFPASAQTFPPLTGRVVDQAGIIPDAEEAQLSQRLAALQQASSRQLVVATIKDLEGYPIEDYGYQLGRKWGIGQNEANNGVILLVAPTERRVRIEVGYGLEPIITDALSSTIINAKMIPAFKANDFAGGIRQGADALIEQLQAPPEEAEKRALEAQQQQARQSSSSSSGGVSIFTLLFWGFILLFVVLPMLRGGRRGRRYGRRGGSGVFIWGPGLGGGWGGGGGGWGGGGGFSGGGGSFGGGGASGGW